MAAQGDPADGVPAAIQARFAALSARGATTATADRLLSSSLHAAYQTAATAHRQLDTIEAEIDGWARAVRVGSPLQAREFGSFLLVKYRELVTIITRAQRGAATGQEALESLRGRYGPAAP